MRINLKDEFYKHLSKVDSISQQFINLYLKNRKDADMERVLAALLGYEKKIYLQENKIGKYTDSYLKLLEELPRNVGDHPKTLVTKEGRYPVTEPYELSLQDLKVLVNFCEKNSFDCVLDGDSPHFVGQTLRIRFIKQK